MQRRAILILICTLSVAGCDRPVSAPVDLLPGSTARADDTPRQLDPADWGGDHVGGEVPDYVTGDECLFCHRKDVGVHWTSNRHQLTIRPADSEPAALGALRAEPALADMAEETQYVMGADRQLRFLRRTDRYGELAIHAARFRPDDDEQAAVLLGGNDDDPLAAGWDEHSFGRSCASCHATGVDAASHTFSALSIDCYACHGDVSLDHSNDTSRVILSKARDDSARVIISICASCHIRNGRSRSTGGPAANNFIAGDNLFRDLEVDFSDEAIQSLNPADRHVLENVRDVVVYGQEKITCLSCHDVHAGSSRRHRRVRAGTRCQTCHRETGPKSMRDGYEVHSEVCEY